MTAPLARSLALLAAIAALALAVAPLPATTPAHAAVSRVYVEAAVIAPGEEVTLNVIAEATSPGIGAWNVDLRYDKTRLTLAHTTSTIGICSPAFAADTARMVGASASGLIGTLVLCTFTFNAGSAEGHATLDLTINQLTDPTGADLSVGAEDGSVTIMQATPTPVPTPTSPPTATPTVAPATPTPAAPPSGGGAPGDGSGITAWLLAIGGLAIVSVAVRAVARTRR